MRDYDKLVKALRETDFSDGCPCVAEPLCEGKDCVIIQAADAIEELIMQQRGNEEAVKVMQMEIDRLLASRTPKEEK